MQVTVLFDDESISDDLMTGFGLSLLIDNTILFDTGSDGEKLLANLSRLKKNKDKIDSVFISHEHWDHVDGLESFLRDHKVMVYLSSGFDKKVKETVNSFDGFSSIAYSSVCLKTNVFSTGELPGKYNNTYIYEQGILIEYAPGYMAMVTGCAHFGIVEGLKLSAEKITKFLNRAVQIDVAIGGFHLSHETDESLENTAKNLKEIGIKKVAPLHCSGNKGKEILLKHYGNNYYDLKVGGTIDL